MEEREETAAGPAAAGEAASDAAEVDAAAGDAADVRAVVAGDHAAFERIVRRWQTPLVNLAFRYCRDRGRAEEMAQDVFVKLFRALATYRGDSRFSTWLFAVAANHFRAQSRRHSPEQVPLEAIAELQDPSTAHGVLEEADRREIVRRSVSSLPRRYRDAVLLFYFFDMDLAAASAALGLPEGTVKARLHRGRGILRRKLAGTAVTGPASQKA